MGEERRQFVRLSSNFNISYKVISPPDGQGSSTGINISEGGISLPISHLLCPGIILELGITLGDGKDTIVTTGEVMWVKERDDSKYPYTIGIKFININPRDHDRIYYHIHKKIDKDKAADVKWIE